MPNFSFGDLLHRYRLEAGLTQEALAERARLSVRGVSDLERGVRHTPRRETLRLLSDALGLAAPAREALEQAAHRPRGGAPVRGWTTNTPESHAVLVGRTREMDRLRGRLERAVAGSGGLVLLSGEPGIGKTRLLEELAAVAGNRGIQVLWGRCWESEGAPPFWPWVEMLRTLVRDREPALLRAELGIGAPLIAEIVPDVREQMPDLPSAPMLEAAEARFRLFDSVAVALQNVAQRQPMLLVLDDLHWADRPSVLLLEFLLQYLGSVRVLIVGAYRDSELDRHHPLTEALGSLRREESFESIPLRGLTVDAVGDLVSSWLHEPGGSHNSALARALWQATEGNPLFVREELRYLTQDDGTLGHKEDWEAVARGVELPQGVRDVISRRLLRLSETTRGVLTVAAVIGREFETGILQLASGLDEPEIDAALDEAQGAHVIDELRRTMGGYRFYHALFREALHAELPARRRIRLHWQVAEALERGHAADLDAHLSELAYHYGEAQALGIEKLVHYSLLAGERALESKAYEDGGAHFRCGLTAAAGRPMDAEQAALLFGLGRAQTATAELHRAHETVAGLTRAFDYYAETGDIDRAVAVAECPVDALPGQPVGAARLVAHALNLVDPDSHAAGRLLSRFARMVAIEEGDYQAAVDACARALAIARREGDIRLEIETLGNGAEADLNYLRWPEGLDKCLRAIDLASRIDAMREEMLARLFAGIILWLSGELSEAGSQAAALLARAEELRDRRWRVSALWLSGALARFRGDWSAARDYTDRGLALSPADPRMLWTRVLLEHHSGNFPIAQSLLDRLLEVVTLTTPVPDLSQATTALVLAVMAEGGPTDNKLHEAETAAEAILSFPAATEMVLRVTRASLAVMAVRRGDAAAAGRYYPALASGRGTVIYEGMAGDRLLALLARTMGDGGVAEAHFEDALTFCRKGGCRPELAWTCHDFAELLCGRGDPGDLERARNVLDEALAISQEVGMRPLIESVLVRREMAKA